MQRSLKHIILVSLIIIGSPFATTKASDLVVSEGKTLSIKKDEVLELVSEKYDNLGTLEIEADGTLSIGSGVVNGTPVTGLVGLNLGVVRSSGSIDAEKILHFQEGSQIKGTVRSTENVVFNGPSTIDARIEAEVLVFNDIKGATEKKASVLKLNDGKELSLDVLLVHGNLKMEGVGKTITLDADLTLGTSGAVLEISEDLIVTGNYAALNGTTIKSGKSNWSVTFQGGGALDENGYNNVIVQEDITGNVRVENNTYLGGSLFVQGNITLGEDSTTFAEKGLLVSGLLTVEKNATLDMIGDAGAMTVYPPGTYNGIFSGGFVLEEGASLTAKKKDHALQLALGSDSSLAANATMSASRIQLSGINGSGSYAVREVENLGTIDTTGVLELIAVKLVNDEDGNIDLHSLKMIQSSTLDLSSSNADDGGLHFSGTGGTVTVGVNSTIKAETKSIHFGSAAVTNHNSSGGIQAREIRFGNGGSYQVGINASGDGAGRTLAHATFEKGSTLILNAAGHTDFDKYNVHLETGSTIEMRINSGLVGTLYTTGKIITEENVVLAIAEGSNFEGRTQTFLVARGGTESEFHEDLLFEDSLFFEMSDYWAQDLKDDKGNEYKGLCVEVVKIADLVDYAGSNNQRRLGKMIDRMMADKNVSKSQAEIYDALMRLSNDATYRRALDSLSGSTRENAAAFALSSPWRRAMDSIGFHRLSLALVKKKTTVAGETAGEDEMFVGQSKSLMPKRSMARGGLAHDLWFDSLYHYNNLDSDENTIGGDGSRGGVVLGMGLPTVSREALLGLTFGYSGGLYKQERDQVDINDYQFGLYGGTNLLNRNLQLRAYVGYGIQDYTMKRKVEIGSVAAKRARSKTDGSSMAAAIMLIRPVDMSPRWILKPSLGIDFERVEQDGFVEYGDKAITWGFDDLSLSRTMMRFGVGSEYQYRRAELTGRLFYGVKLAGDNAASSRHYNPSLPTYEFDISGVSIGTGVFDLGLGTNIGLNASRTSLLFIDYNGTFTGHGNAHTGSLGILLKR